MAPASPSVVHVAVGVLTDGRGRVLIARRATQTHQGGLWEFPGGKVERGETILAALRRELAEELGIRVVSAEPMLRIPHDYGDKRVLLDVHRVGHFEGEVRGLENQPLRWVAPSRLGEYRFPDANGPIVTALSLPPICLITPALRGESDFLAGVRRALAAGVRFVQLRRHDLAQTDYVRLARRVDDLCREAGALLAVNAAPGVAHEIGARACHLSAASAAACPPGRRPVARDVWLGASCHDRSQVERALNLDVDYLLVSPIRATVSHPTAAPLGWDGLERLIRDVPRPVYALGGMRPEDLPTARGHGAHGVAAIRALWPDVTGRGQATNFR